MIKKCKKIFSVVLSAVLIISFFTACSDSSGTTNSAAGQSAVVVQNNGQVYNPLGSEAKNGTIKLKVWGPDAAQELLRKQCDEFSKSMSEYAKIEIELVPQGEADPAAQLLNDSTVAADVFGFACDSIDKLVSAGALMEVAGRDLDFVVEENSPDSVLAATVDGKVYGYPETGDNSYCLVYNKKVVSDEQAKTLEGVLKACKAQNKKFVMDAGDGFYSCLFMFTGGLKTEGLEQDGTTQKFSSYSMRTVTKTLMAFRSLFEEYKDVFVNGESTKVVDGFLSDTVGAGFDGSWNFSAAKEVLGTDAGFAVLPTINVEGTPTQIINMFGYKLIGVNSSTKYPNTSAELAKFLTNEDCQKDRAVDLNWGPSNRKVAESTLIKSDAALSAILNQASYSVPQVGISAGFWTPVATLGEILVDFNQPLSEKDCEELVRKTISTIRDE